jgi:hypothetical protein
LSVALPLYCCHSLSVRKGEEKKAKTALSPPLFQGKDTNKMQLVTTNRQTATNKKKHTSAAARLAWVLWALSLVLAALGVLLVVLNHNSNAHVFDYWVENTVIALVFSPVGAVIVAHRSRHLVGWIFCAIGLLAAARTLGGDYAAYALLAAPGSLPGGEVVAWIISWLWVLHHGLFALLFLVFPDGRLPTPRWRWIAWLGAAVIGVGTVWVAFSAGPVDGLAPVENPLGIEAVGNAYGLVKAVSFALGFGAAVDLFVRLRYARGAERQQLKWCAYVVTVLVGGATLAYTVAETMGVWSLWWVGIVLLMVGLWGLPIAVGIAIVRHTLFDIDLIINLTLVYGLLTTALASVFEGSLALLEHLFLAHIEMETEVTIFVSALVVAVLFAPLRSRLEAFLSRRGVRRGEDAV